MTVDENARRPLDPVVAGLADGASAGYHAVELVVKGLHEGLRRQGVMPGQPGSAGPAGPAGPGPARSAPPRAGRAAAGPAPLASAWAQRSGESFGRAATSFSDHATPGGVASQAFEAPYALAQALYGQGGRELLDIFADILDELLRVASNVTRALADLLGGYEAPQIEEHAPHTIHLRAYPGRTVRGDFAVWNTSTTTLSDVRFSATDLVSAMRHTDPQPRLDASAVSFHPPLIRHVGRHAHEVVHVEVAVGPMTAPGMYRGVVQATIGHAWAVVDLEVSPSLSA